VASAPVSSSVTGSGSRTEIVSVVFCLVMAPLPPLQPGRSRSYPAPNRPYRTEYRAPPRWQPGENRAFRRLTWGNSDKWIKEA
jgi:hypothetical protein